jgi:hypothetical protein
MKTNFFRATAMAVAVLFAGGVAAQNNESINADTTTVGAQQVSNQKGQTTPRVIRVKKVIKTATKADSVVYKNGATEVYTDQAVTSMTDATLDGILSGDIKAVKKTNRNYDGQLRRRAYIGFTGGAIFGDNVDPLAGATVGYDTWNFDFSFSGFWSQGHLPDHADEPGERYDAIYFYLDGTWKALHTSNGYFWVGPGAGLGYGHQKTNDLNNGGSTNSGVTGRAFLAIGYQVTRNLTLKAKAGALLKVEVDHAQNNTEWQDMKNIKPFVEIGAAWNF